MMFRGTVSAKRIAGNVTHCEDTDADLLLRLRAGDSNAYEVLWARHVSAALRVAYRTFPSRAEDLVADSFLRVYQQVTTTSSGPKSAFRAYLFTVMRNTAIRWGKDAERVDVVAEIEIAQEQDAFDLVQEEARAALLLASFRALPERWQRVLWLSDIEGVGRPAIAAEFEITPNAVSALVRRARGGLRLQWLTFQIPEDLRHDLSHQAYRLPEYVLDLSDRAVGQEVELHLAQCSICADLKHELIDASTSVTEGSLRAVGFLALGVTLPSVSAVTVGVAGGGAALLAGVGTSVTVGSAISGSLIGATSVGTATILAGALVVGLLTTSFIRPNADSEVGAHASVSEPAPLDSNSGSLRMAPPEYDLDLLDRGTGDQMPIGIVLPETSPIQAAPSDGADTATSEPPQVESSVPIVPSFRPPTGRGVSDSSIEVVDLGRPNDVRTPELNPGPKPVTPGRPKPPINIDETPPTDRIEVDQPLTPGIVTPAKYEGYFPPVLEGKSSPGSEVFVTVNDREYAAEIAETGEWSFDLRFIQTYPGTVYTYEVQAVSAHESSEVVSGEFMVTPLEVTGFEGNPVLDISEARDSGIVMSVQGPISGRICVATMQEHYAEFDLGPDGSAYLRLRMHSNGFYVFNFRPCESEYIGGTVETYVQVFDPEILFDPWGPDPADMTFELSPL